MRNFDCLLSEALSVRGTVGAGSSTGGGVSEERRGQYRGRRNMARLGRSWGVVEHAFKGEACCCPAGNGVENA